MCVCVYMCECVSVYVRERERERKSEWMRVVNMERIDSSHPQVGNISYLLGSYYKRSIGEARTQFEIR